MIPLPRLIIIADWRLGPVTLVKRLQRALEAGPEIAVQHRQPDAPVRELLENGRTLAKLCRPGGNPLFINGRLDVARALEAHLHLPAGGLTAAQARPHLQDRLISVAVHNAAEAIEAAGADLALVSPVYPAGSKPDDSRAPLGVDGFQVLAGLTPCPAFALGGITPDRLLRFQPAGAAVMSGVLDAPDPLEAARALLKALTPVSARI